MRTSSDLIKMAAKNAIDLEWGSEEQIEAENDFFALGLKLGFDAEENEDFQGYALKATTEEAINYALKEMNLPVLS